MLLDTAVWSCLQPSLGGSVAAVVWQHLCSSGNPAAVVAVSVL
jgi:hypothetical protein